MGMVVMPCKDPCYLSVFIYDHVQDKIRADQFRYPNHILVEGIRLKDTVSGRERTLECKGVFMAIGHTPNTAFLGDAVPLKPTGYMEVEAGSTRTEIPGVFGAGDVMDDTYRQAVTAAGTGCMAALEAEKWLAENE